MTSLSISNQLSRRSFLIRTGCTAVGITFVGSCSSIMPALPSTSSPEQSDGMFWLQLAPDGKVRFLMPRMELGQGANVGLIQVVAEELNVPPDDIVRIAPDTENAPEFKMTVGSESIQEFFEPVSFGAAQLRESARRVAAEKFGVSIANISDALDGFTIQGGRFVSYKEIAAGKPLILTEDQSRRKRDRVKQYSKDPDRRMSSIGVAWRNPAVHAIVTGAIKYARDVQVDQMVFGDVLRPPGFGYRLKRSDFSRAELIPGVKIVRKGKTFLGVVAESSELLKSAVDAIDLEWTGPVTDQRDLDLQLDVLRVQNKDDFEHVLERTGRVKEGARNAVRSASSVYRSGFAAHAAMEPRSSVVHVAEKEVKVWCGTQDPFYVQRRVAKAIGRDAGDVHVYPQRVGGGFGGRVVCQASEEAAILSAVVGKPVRVQWGREAEFSGSYYHPGFSHAISAGVDGHGKISHWEHDFVSAPIMTGLVPGSLAWAVDKVVADEGTARGARLPYAVSHLRTRYADIRTVVPIGPWRGLGAAPNNFAVECMIDELASAAGADPIRFRIQNLPSGRKRWKRVLEEAARLSRWDEKATNHGKGMAFGLYKGQTAVAVVVEVRILPKGDEFVVERVWCAQDCGRIINPSQVENQVLGNIVWGCSFALKEQMVLEGGRPRAVNFNNYQILRHDESPEIEVSLIDVPDAPPVGVGEAALGPVAPAIANAVFAATGKRLRDLPLRLH